MSTNTKSPDEVADLVQALPPHLRENFEKADGELRHLYGDSPGIAALVRMWLACGTSSQIAREFELAVMDIKRRDLSPNDEDYFDEDI